MPESSARYRFALHAKFTRFAVTDCDPPRTVRDTTRPEEDFMKLLPRLVASSFAAAALVVGGAVPAFATSTNGAHHQDDGSAVFVQTDNQNGNKVVAYDRHNDGSLTFEHAYATRGN